MPIMSEYYSLGLALRLRDYDLEAICQGYPNTCDNKIALKDVLLVWLRQRYNVEKFGPPTWRMLVEAVDKETGGNDHGLAKKIASNHLAGIEMESCCNHIYILYIIVKKLARDGYVSCSLRVCIIKILDSC